MQYSITEFEAIYHTCFPPAMRLAAGMLHDDDDARDTVQEVFIKLWESDVEVVNPQAFIMRSVRNACLNRISAADTRERFRRSYTLDEFDETFDIEAQSHDIQMAVQTRLTEREQQVIGKLFADGLSYKEAAQSLEVSVASINKNVVSALKKLRIYFKTNLK